MIPKEYREDYPGEFVITHTTFKRGKKEQTREWIENPIEVHSHSKRACCIAPYTSHTKIPLVRIENHRGDLLGRNRMQLYAADDIWKGMKADFTVITEQSRLDEVLKSNYQVDNVVYTTAARCIANPGEFYLIPLGAYYAPVVTTVWLACFDGHKEVYLYGYDELDMPEKFILQIRDIMSTYNEVQFYHVTDSTTPDAWMRRTNCTPMSTRDFVSLCDI